MWIGGFEAWLAQEARFRMVELRSPARYRLLLHAAREAVRQRRALYERLSEIHLPIPLPTAEEESDHG